MIKEWTVSKSSSSVFKWVFKCTSNVLKAKMSFPSTLASKVLILLIKSLDLSVHWWLVQNHVVNKHCIILVLNHVRPVSPTVFFLEHNCKPRVINLRSVDRLEGACESFDKMLSFCKERVHSFHEIISGSLKPKEARNPLSNTILKHLLCPLPLW